MTGCFLLQRGVLPLSTGVTSRGTPGRARKVSQFIIRLGFRYHPIGLTWQGNSLPQPPEPILC